jgi:hypothetical protein
MPPSAASTAPSPAIAVVAVAVGSCSYCVANVMPLLTGRNRGASNAGERHHQRHQQETATHETERKHDKWRQRRVWWRGRHLHWDWLCSPLGKVHPGAHAVLRAHGWRQVPNDCLEAPVFSFTSWRSADIPVDCCPGPGVPRIRQMPSWVTSILDDKVQLCHTMRAYGATACMPESAVTLAEVSNFQHQTAGVASATSARWFVKHRKGVKGKAVHPCASLQEVDSCNCTICR